MRKTFIIAEIGNTHEGSLGLAKCFIKAAADCGVDAVKFQTHIFEAESLPNAPNPPYFNEETRKEYFERTAFKLKELKELKRFTEKEYGLEFISSPFSLEAVDLLQELGVKTYKIPSGEVSNIPLLVKIARTNRKVLLSSGMSNWKELDEAVMSLKENGCKDLILLQCTSKYPSSPEDAGLNVLSEMKQRYKVPVGLSDHTLGLGVSIAAIVLGAEIIERHFTLSKLMYGSDAKYSLEPHQLKLLTNCIREVELAIHTKIDKDEIAQHLKNIKEVFEKSIVASCNIKLGTVIEERHLAYKKPGDGIPANKFREIIGKRVKKDLKKNYKFRWEDFE